VENPSQQIAWNVDLADRVFAPPKAPKSFEFLFGDPATWMVDKQGLKVLQMEKWCLVMADECAAVQGLVVDDGGRRVLARAIAAAVQRASLTLARLAKGETAPGLFLSPGSAPQLSFQSQRTVLFDELVKGWAAERRPVAKTLYEWSRVVRQLEAYLGHREAHRLTADDLVEWKRSMVEASLRPKTIQDAKLAPLRAILQWGVQNKLIGSNPADGISLDVRSKQNEKKRSSTDEEAKIVLRAALIEDDPVRRWVPWIGAYSGVRVSEICRFAIPT
jgi:hypothetical protein